MFPDTPQAPSNGQTSSEVALRTGKRVRSASTLQEEEREEDEELCPEVSLMGSSVDTESLKGCYEHEDDGPPMVKREWKVDKNFVGQVVPVVVLLDDIIDVADG